MEPDFTYLGPTAYEGLTDLISFIGSFVTSPLWFGISVLQLMALTFIIHFVIGLLLGGISPRSNFEKQPVSTDNSFRHALNDYDLREKSLFTGVRSRSAFNTSTSLSTKEGLIHKNLKGL